jgi:hypothetical protein
MKAKMERCQSPITRQVVVLLGDLSSGPWLLNSSLNSVIQAFGWSLEHASNFDDLRRIHRIRPVVTVLFEPKALGMSWNQSLGLIRQAAPEALPMVCQRFSETAIWPDLAAAGAFHSLSLPLDARELRQSLGFVWTAKGSPATEVSPMRREPLRRPANPSHAVAAL